MSLSVLPMFSSKSFIVSGLTFRSLIHFEFFLCMVLGSVLISFFYMSCPVFPAPFLEEAIFAPLYILASFVKYKVSIGVWIYLWAFYFVPLIYISVFVPVPYCFDDCSFLTYIVWSQEGWFLQLHSSFQDCFGYWGVFVFPYEFKIFALGLWKMPLVIW